jgi:hypothetical protein
MKPQLRITSAMLLIALLFSLAPALALPSGVSAATCDWAQFVTDVTVPDGTKYDPGTAFKKTWRLKNIGTCTWTTSYSLVFESGAQMGASASVKFPSEVRPGQTIDISVDMTAPTAAGHYRGYWKFKNASGVLFGIGYTANRPWWVDINVTSSAPSGSVVFDFAASAKDATWSSGAGGLTFPGTDGDAKGFVLAKDKPKFESGVELSKPGLLFAPQSITNGFIQAEYPAYKVDPGDYFQTTVGCEFGSTSCYVAYRLDYKIGNTIKTFWSFRERYEGWTYNANISLAPLSGKEVKFILYISAYGSPSGDRALWGNPVITRKGIVPPPPTVTGTPPTATPTKTQAPVTETVPPSSCDKVQFIKDVNFPDGTVVQPGAQFTKTWRLKNVGSCAWTTSYQLVFFSGEKMGAASSAAFTKNVAVGETVDISMNMVAPTSPGTYRGYWMFKNASGALFGIGAQANKPWWVEIKVTGGPTVTPVTATATATQSGPATSTPTSLPNTGYDFVANACSASWFSGAQTGALPCPGTDGDAKGFVLKVNSPVLENGKTDPRPGLVTFPQNKQDGYIQGIYPAFTVQSGDRFQSTINCARGSTNCYVVFRLDYQTGSDPIKTFWGPFLERHEGGIFDVDIDLTPLAGKDVKFILTNLAAGSPSGDRALWVGPRIYRSGGTSALPDLMVTQTKVELPNPSCLSPGDAFGLRVWVTNGGQASAASFNVKFNDAQQTVNGLAVGETKSVFFPNYSNPNNNPITVTVDPAGAIAESNEQNNTHTETLQLVTPTPPVPCTVTVTPPPDEDPTADWEYYFSDQYGFIFGVPPTTFITDESENHARLNLPLVNTGTNLSEKYVDLTIVEGANPCKSPDIGGTPASTETVTINGIQFFKETGDSAGAGNRYDFVAYSTAADGNCVSLTFVLHSLNPGNFPTPPPEFDKAAESAVFDLIINTFDWTG